MQTLTHIRTRTHTHMMRHIGQRQVSSMQWKKESERQFRQKEYIIFKQLTQRKAEKEKKQNTSK